VLHVATHGFFLPDQPYQIVCVLSPDGTKKFYRVPADPENPLLRCGLMMAGANHRHSGHEGGILTGLEASGLDLHGTQLVVLSACQTGLGDIVPGEGVFGLRRALVVAGAQTQVMSLWPVDDEATLELMK
jgi:CHAT domain-containing protein